MTLTKESLGVHPTSQPSNKMLDDVGFDFDDLGKHSKVAVKKSNIWIFLCLLPTIVFLFILKPLFGLGIMIGIMLGCVIFLIVFGRGKRRY